LRSKGGHRRHTPHTGRRRKTEQEPKSGGIDQPNRRPDPQPGCQSGRGIARAGGGIGEPGRADCRQVRGLRIRRGRINSKSYLKSSQIMSTSAWSVAGRGSRIQIRIRRDPRRRGRFHLTVEFRERERSDVDG
jgi:hypothetical protein